jgi:hypothetical protein
MWAALIPVLGNVLDKIFPDKTKADEAKARLLELQMNGELQQIMGQLEINKEEAKSTNMFVSGWRPSVGWCCSFAMAYQFLVRPIATGFGHPMPPIDVEALNTLLFAMLGVAGLRSVEKVKGVA